MTAQRGSRGEQQAGSPAADGQDGQPLGGMGAVEDVDREHHEVGPATDLVDEQRS